MPHVGDYHQHAARSIRVFAGSADGLFEKGLIDNPKNKAKSLSLTPEGIAHARAVLAREFSKAE